MIREGNIGLRQLYCYLTFILLATSGTVVMTLPMSVFNNQILFVSRYLLVRCYILQKCGILSQNMAYKLKNRAS